MCIVSDQGAAAASFRPARPRKCILLKNMEFLFVYCPACEAAYRVPGDRAEQMVRMRCGRCGLVFEPDLKSARRARDEADPGNSPASPPSAPSSTAAPLTAARRAEAMAHIGPPPPYRPVKPARTATAAPTQPAVGRPPPAANPAVANKYGPIPPYRPIGPGPRPFARGQAPDLEPWRSASLVRAAPDSGEDGLDGHGDPNGPIGPGLAIGPRGGQSASPSWSIRREPPRAMGPVDFSLFPLRTELPPAEPGAASTRESEPASPIDDDEADAPPRRGMFVVPLPWVAIPVAAGVLGGALYQMRDGVMRVFPGTIPIYAALRIAPALPPTCPPKSGADGTERPVDPDASCPGSGPDSEPPSPRP